MQAATRTKDEFVQAIVDAYISGTENAYEAYQDAGFEPYEGESDIDYVLRCAEQDYHDKDYDGCIYADYLTEA